jgi:isopentenyl-diphosphate Delta-isomerase
MNRKDDHINEALRQSPHANDFDGIRFVPDSLAKTDVKDVDCSTSFVGHTFSAPIYINAMTGGSETSLTINSKLAEVAKAHGLMIASGSVSAAIKDHKWEPTFRIIRETYPDGCVAANIGLSQDLEGAKKAVAILDADVLQIHLNAPQEIVMPEGDRDFSSWPRRLEDIVRHVGVPVIVKDVGFGMSRTTVSRLASRGVRHIDVSGRGGTNFIDIENARRDMRLDDFTGYGFSTPESLLDIHGRHDMTVFASGGVRGAYDIVKSLYLGADMVGLSGFFLRLVSTHDVHEAIKRTGQLIGDVKGIMAVLNAKSIHELRKKEVIFSPSLKHFMKEREITLPRG